MSALLPCPFCGGEAVMVIGALEFSDAEVHCKACATQSGNYGGGLLGANKDAAIAAWNRRATPAEVETLRARVERLEMALKPFAGAADWLWDETIWRGVDPAEAKVLWSEQAKQGITRGHFNAARAALEDRT